MAWPAHHASTRPATATGFTAMACNFPNRLNASRTSPDAEFSNMILAERGFQANSRIITTSDDMLQEVVNLKRG